jgi:hypothetical protein
MMRRITTILSDWKQKNQILATILIALVSVVILTTIAFLILNCLVSPETLLGTTSRTATTTDPNGAKTTVEETLSSTTPRFEILKTALTIGAGISALGILALSYRKQKDLEDSHFVERFGAAAEQLGHTDAAVRLAGVYAMTTVANQYSNFDQRQQCIDVLCGYLRLPYNPEDQKPHQTNLRITEKADTTSTSEAEFTYRQDDSEVRNTILRTIVSHIQHDAKTSWSKHDFDFTGAYLEEGNFEGARFNGQYTRFDKTHFNGEYIQFNHAQFNGEVTGFDGAQFNGKLTTFGEAQFNAKYTQFNHAQFNGEGTRFDKTHFNGEVTGFEGAQFNGSGTGFFEAQFNGSGTWFFKAQFNGNNTSFDRAQFNGKITGFDGAQFNGKITSFNGAKFNKGGISFRSEFLSTKTDFSFAEFTADVSFQDSTIGTGEIVTDWKANKGPQPENVRPNPWPPN